jgi:hypothetical protein
MRSIWATALFVKAIGLEGTLAGSAMPRHCKPFLSGCGYLRGSPSVAFAENGRFHAGSAIDQFGEPSIFCGFKLTAVPGSSGWMCEAERTIDIVLRMNVGCGFLVAASALLVDTR